MTSSRTWGKLVIFAALASGIIAVALSSPVFATESMSKGRKGVPAKKDLKKRLSQLTENIVSLAKKWARKRGISFLDILTTIILESGGNPHAHALSTKEDSRGLMQVNIRAHEKLLKELGYSANDLFVPEVAIEVGTHILAANRNKVLSALQKAGKPQDYTVDVLTRLYYVGPKYTLEYIKTGKPFRNMQTYIEHWQTARRAVADRLAEKGYA